MSAGELLSNEVFKVVVDATPLVSIDLVVRDAAGRILLGLRKNRPAKAFWFVPGGRVRKGETLDEAFRRLAVTELGLELSRDGARFVGVYEHLYADSVFGVGADSPSTHYVVLAYELVSRLLSEEGLPLSQHDKFHWWTVPEALESAAVHENTKAYCRQA